MKRGHIVTVALQGDYGKPRPAVIIQSNRFLDGHPSVLICPITSHLLDVPLLWIEVQPSPHNGLKNPSRIMADRIVTMRPERIGRTIGELDTRTLKRLDRVLALIVGLTE